MDTQQQKDILQGVITTKSKEIEAMQVAIAILEDRFQTESFALNNANATITTLNAEKQTLITEKQALEEENTTLKAEKEALPK